MSLEHYPLTWLLFNILSIIFLASYSMLEMACVSFNKIRLQYYVSKGVRRALWLNYLLQNPSRLFGTTLICVNIALVIGSECARQFYASLGLSPDIAPLTQTLLVVVFGELAPMFAARHYPEHVAMLGVPLLYFSAKIMTPFLSIFSVIAKFGNRLIGGSESKTNIYINQEELLKILEEQDDDAPSESESEEYNAIATNIFSLRGKDVRQIMQPISKEQSLPSNATIAQLEQLFAHTGNVIIPIYHNEITNIVGIANPRDMLRATETQRVRDYARPPWCVTETMTMMHILKQFRSNNESVAIVINPRGKAIGIVHLDDVLEEIFGKYPLKITEHTPKLMLIDKTFPGDMTVAEFQKQFGISIHQDAEMTLSDVMSTILGHNPEKGESVYLAPFELTVKETSLLSVKEITISTRL